MSQTETLLLVALGFSLAALIALFIGRMMWNIAVRLGARRMQKQVPSSLVGLQTERDRLRAEYAMLSQRLGSRLEAVKLRMAEQMAEVSRHRNRLDEMQKSLAHKDAELQRLGDEIEGQKTQAAAAAEREAALRTSLAEKEQALESLRRLHAEELRKLTEETVTLTPDAVSVPEAAAESENRVRNSIGKLNDLAQSVAHDRANPGLASVSPPPPPSDPLILEKLKDAERETGDLQRELEQLDAEWSRRLDEMNPEGAAARDTGTTAVANVISLANRIRDLKKGLGNG